MAKLNRGSKEIVSVNISIFSVQNGFIMEIQKDKSMDSTVMIARSRDEINKLIEEIPDLILGQLNKESN